MVSTRDTGETSTVYNLRVADYHTYFVGGGEWDFAVWAHNLDCTDVWKAIGGTGEIPEAAKEALTNVVMAYERGAGKGEIAKLLKEIPGGFLKSKDAIQLTEIVEGLIEGPPVRKITRGLWGAEIEYAKGPPMKAIDHIKSRHFVNSERGSKVSRFSAENSNTASVKKLTQEAIALGDHTVTHGEYSVRYTFSEEIGTDRFGTKTNTLQVFLDEFGNVVTAFPIPNP